ncbi:MAG TPA: cysteine desulfurase-like protein [Gemmatimonadaceae bacterium]|nr:cysteine desulfurase-like protein [Gemmatimonadaceae bacterium]
MSIATVEEIRARFPALSRLHAGERVAYFDGPGGTQVPLEVVDAMTEYLFEHNANTDWRYPSSAETDAMLESARETFADFVGGASDEIAFGANMTTLTFHFARAIGRTLEAGDEIVITELDHHGNVAPWVEAARENALTVRVAPMRPHDGTLDLDALEALIGPRTRVVAIGAASNALGTITDVARVAARARSAGALTYCDAVHYAPHALVDVGALGCDFLACSAYKFYGPHVGVVWGRRDLLASLDVPRLTPAPDTVPERVETGTLNHEGIAGAAAAVDFLASLARTSGPRRQRLQAGLDELHRRGRALLARAWRGLSSIPGVRLYGPTPDQPRTPTVCFTIDGVGSETVVRQLVDRAVFATHGDFYAATVASRLGHADDGLVRAGCACYTSDSDVDRLVEGIRAITKAR